MRGCQSLADQFMVVFTANWISGYRDRQENRPGHRGEVDELMIIFIVVP